MQKTKCTLFSGTPCMSTRFLWHLASMKLRCWYPSLLLLACECGNLRKLRQIAMWRCPAVCLLLGNPRTPFWFQWSKYRHLFLRIFKIRLEIMSHWDVNFSSYWTWLKAQLGCAIYFTLCKTTNFSLGWTSRNGAWFLVKQMWHKLKAEEVHLVQS